MKLTGLHGLHNLDWLLFAHRGIAILYLEDNSWLACQVNVPGALIHVSKMLFYNLQLVLLDLDVLLRFVGWGLSWYRTILGLALRLGWGLIFGLAFRLGLRLILGLALWLAGGASLPSFSAATLLFNRSGRSQKIGGGGRVGVLGPFTDGAQSMVAVC